MASTDYCTVLDKLDEKTVLFVAKNCLTTIVGNPQRKVTVFVPSKGFKNSQDFKAHVCGGEWSIDDLKKYAATKNPVLISKGGPDDTRYKYKVELKGSKLFVGGVELMSEDTTAKNGVIYKIGNGTLDKSDVAEDVVRKKKSSKKTSKSMHGGAPPIFNTLAIDETLIGFELRERILNSYKNELSNVPLGDPGCWPNLLWSNFVNYACESQSLGFNWLQNLSPILGSNYHSNVQLVFQPTTYDLSNYLVADQILREFATTNHFLNTDIRMQLDSASQIMMGLGFELVRPNGHKVMLAGYPNELLHGGDGPMEINYISEFTHLQQQLDKELTATKEQIANVFPEIVSDCDHPVDPYVRGICAAVFTAVYGPDNIAETSNDTNVYGINQLQNKNKPNIVNNLMQSFSKEIRKNTNIRIAVTETIRFSQTDFRMTLSGVKSNKYRSLIEYSQYLQQGILPLPHKAEFAREYYFELLLSLALAMYIKTPEYCTGMLGILGTIKPTSNLACIRYFLDYSSQRQSLEDHRGIRFSKNLKLDKCDVYTERNCPKQDFVAYAINVPSSPFSALFQPIGGIMSSINNMLIPSNQFYIMSPADCNAYVCVILCALSWAKEGYKNNDVFVVESVYRNCVELTNTGNFVMPCINGITRIIQAPVYFSSKVPRALYNKVYKHVWETHKDCLKSGKLIIESFTHIFNSLVDNINTDITQAKTEPYTKRVFDSSYAWYLRDGQYRHISNVEDFLYDTNLSHFLMDFRVNILDHLYNPNFNNIVNGIRLLAPNEPMGSPNTLQHYSTPGFLYSPGSYNEIRNSSRAKWNQVFSAAMNKDFSTGTKEVVKMYDLVHYKHNGYFGGNYQALSLLHPKVSTTMFYSDFMKFLSASDTTGGGIMFGGAMIDALYASMFTGDIDASMKNLLNPTLNTLDVSVIDAFVNSKYFLYNTFSELNKAPRVVWDTEHPNHQVANMLLQ